MFGLSKLGKKAKAATKVKAPAKAKTPIRDAPIVMQEIMNFEEACQYNLSILQAGANSGILYMGRFEEVRHHFFCYDQNSFFNFLINDHEKSFRVALSTGKNVFRCGSIDINQEFLSRKEIRYIDVYKNFVTSSGYKIFSKRESVRIHFPEVNEDHIFFRRVNPVIRMIPNKDIYTQQTDIKVSGFNFKTLPEFKIYKEASEKNIEKIDIVYTWVDGDDPGWLHRKNEYMPHSNPEDSHSSATSDSRFKHIDELLYSIRSLYMYTNFVRHIYLVTDNQTPAWMKKSNHITIINHSEIFPESRYLPTFNSHSIESCLHRINGLSENFIYFNDDLIMGRSNTINLFFSRRMLPKIYYSNFSFIGLGSASPNDFPVDSAAKNIRDFMQENYGHFVNRKFKHVPCPVSKKHAQELEDVLKDQLETTRSNKFRSYKDFSFLTSSYYHYIEMRNHFSSGQITYAYIDINDPERVELLKQQMSKVPDERWDILCLNDVEREQGVDLSHISQKIMPEFFPFPSPAEIACSQTET